MLRVQDFNTSRDRDHPGRDIAGAFRFQDAGEGFPRGDVEEDFFEVKDDMGDIFEDAINRGEFMGHAIDFKWKESAPSREERRTRRRALPII